MGALLPTPWEPVGNRSVRCAFEAGNAEKPGFVVATVPMFLPSDEAQRVARLIAAGPDLLEALKGLYEACELRANADGGDFGEDIGPAAYLAEAAIAKATGAA